MKSLRVIIGIVGSGAAFFGIFIFLVWKKRQLSNKKVRKNQRLPCQRKLKFNKANDKIRDVNGSLSEISDEASVTSSQSFTSSITSITSCEYNLTVTNSDDNDSGNSSSDTDLELLCATGISTYKDIPECQTMITELTDLDVCPVVTQLYPDSRCPKRNDSDEESRVTSQNIVMEYEGQLTPKDINQTVENVGGTYSSIVSPLQPNTGTIISPAFRNIKDN